MRLHSTLVLVVGALLADAGIGQSIDSRYQSGVEAFRQRDALAAIDFLGSIIEERPGYRDAQILLGQSYLLIGDDGAAKRHFERALEINPQHGEAAFLLGFSLYQGARYFEAANALERAARMSTQHPLPKMYLGLALLRLGDVDRASAQIEQALKLAPRDPVALTARAELNLALGNYQEAESAIRAALSTRPEDLDARILLGRVLFESGRPQEATFVFESALEDAATSRSDALYLLAQSQLRAGNSEAGQANLKRFQQVREKEERVRVLRSVLSSEPNDIDAGVELASVLLELGHRHMAQIQVGDLRRRAPGDPRLRKLVQLFGD